jgi:tRNA pseudouridine synthase 10
MVIEQKTPQRVAHRRADKVRKRKVVVQDAKVIDDGKLWMRIKTEAGTYVKEFVSGDDGRTKPSIADMLSVKANVEKLTVVGFEDEW